ncbi:MAG: hypothetical protein WBP13_00765 [Methylophilaceae bacterium]
MQANFIADEIKRDFNQKKIPATNEVSDGLKSKNFGDLLINANAIAMPVNSLL